MRQARRRDVADLQALERRVFATDRLSRRSMIRHLDSPSARFLVAEWDGRPVGYALVFLRRGSDAARLYSIARDPNATVPGIGPRLLAAAEAAARAAGARRILLEVRPDNTSALRLYARAGYRVCGRRADYYEDGTDALRMTKQLEPGGD